VCLHLCEVPDDVDLRVGTTGSVLVVKRTAGSEAAGSLTPVPRALQ